MKAQEITERRMRRWPVALLIRVCNIHGSRFVWRNPTGRSEEYIHIYIYIYIYVHIYTYIYIYTALIWAASNGHRDVAELLLDRGAAVDIQDNGGYTAPTPPPRLAH